MATPAPHDPQLLKGVLTTIVLRLLADEESYGYQLVSRIHDLGLPDVAEGSVYPALSRYERDGWITSRLVASTSGPARKYYRLTAAGRQELDTRIVDWLAFATTVNDLLATPVPTAPKEAPQ